MIKNWQDKIIEEAQKRLNRNLSEQELKSIRIHKGYLALEAIEDTVKALSGEELEEYLSQIKNNL
jgi:microsomal dipeptidase-like Zn-dependent dipeptidase